jgi:hypothetical protein
MQEPKLSQAVVWSSSLAWASHCSYLHVVRMDEVLLCTRNGEIFRHCEKFEMLVLLCFIFLQIVWQKEVERLAQIWVWFIKTEMKEGKNNSIYSFSFLKCLFKAC